jgi:3-hydroxybutyryl-CoA dehydrogenase
MAYRCDNCNKKWDVPVEKCIFCDNVIKSDGNGNKHEILSYSEVNIPSLGNEKVPYYIYLLKDENENKFIKKSFSKYQLGDLFESENNNSRDLVIGIVGTGLLGSQIAHYILEYGYKTIIKTRSEDQKFLISNKIRKKLSKKLTAPQAEKCLQRLHTTTDYSDLFECNIVIEASAENIDIKKQIFKELSLACNEKCIFATNTSSLSIDTLAEASNRPDKVIGMHFFNPVHKMDLVEIILGENTSQSTKNLSFDFSIDLNKSPVVVKNSPGFIVNRYLLPQINEAIRMLEEGVSSREDIDSAIKMGLNHPMGPLELADFIGLDICLSILEVLSEGLGSERFKPAELLSAMVNEGKLGVKSGEGFYKY